MDDEEGFVSIGTAFEYLETDEDVVKAKEKKEKELYVLDKQGRRRFHGAFTGGFSAGYFMSVGSKEGWSPAPFVSSRSQKASQPQQRPEDYMDEEDLDSFGIAPRQVLTRDQFTQERSAPPEVLRKRPSVIPGAPPLHTLVLPTKSTIGAQLMKSMGWREGKGVGPTTRDAKVKVYGCSIPGNATGCVELTPYDISCWDFSGKSNLHGIGYRGMSQEHFTTSQFNKGVYGMSGQAFGVGALEDDDDDIFSQDTFASYHTAVALPSDADQSSKYGWTGSSATVGETWGLSSFCKSSTKCYGTKMYPPPTVPRGFVPFHKFSAASSTAEIPVKTIAERECIVNDGSVFNLVSFKDRERLMNAREAKQFSVEGYQPFKDNPVKQSRYDAYLHGSKSTFPDKSLTEWEKQKEKHEFNKLASVHKPLTTALSDKFTRGTIEDDNDGEQQVDPAEVEMFGIMTREETEWHPHRVLCKRFNIPDPYPSSDIVGVPSVSEIDWRHKMTFEASATNEVVPNLYSKGVDAQPMVLDKVQQPLGETLSQVDEEEKPSTTFLKSIFAESSSDEECQPHPLPQSAALPEPHPLPQSSHSSLPHLHPHFQDTNLNSHPVGSMKNYSQGSGEVQPLSQGSGEVQTLSQGSGEVQTLSKGSGEVQTLSQGSGEVQTLSRGSGEVQESGYQHGSVESNGNRWKNFAEVIKPTFSLPQTLETPLVYVKEVFGPSLPPSSAAAETEKQGDSLNEDSSGHYKTRHHHKQHGRHKRSHHHKAKRKHQNKHHHSSRK